MDHRLFWASFKVNNFSNFCPFATFDSSNVAELFNLNSGVRVRVRGSAAVDVSRGSLTGLEIV
jgi:hypothetical protein